MWILISTLGPQAAGKSKMSSLSRTFFFFTHIISFSNNALSFLPLSLTDTTECLFPNSGLIFRFKVSLESDRESGSLPKKLRLQNQRRKIGIIKQSLQVITWKKPEDQIKLVKCFNYRIFEKKHSPLSFSIYE